MFKKLFLILSFLLFSNVSFSQRNTYDPEMDQLTNQLTNDLTAAGFAVGVALSGSVPLALTSGFLTKYIVTYGIAGVKALVRRIKGDPLEDLGQVNLYTIYLLHIKRNLFKSIIDIRKSTKLLLKSPHYLAELEKLENYFKKNCQGDCKRPKIDLNLLEETYLNTALDGKENLSVNKFVNLEQLKSHYFYLNNLYMDIVFAEQLLTRTQIQVLSNQMTEIFEVLKENPYMSNEEKEYRFQSALNVALRWKKNMAEKLIMINEVISPKLSNLVNENSDLKNKIKRYKR